MIKMAIHNGQKHQLRAVNTIKQEYLKVMIIIFTLQVASTIL